MMPRKENKFEPSRKVLILRKITHPTPHKSSSRLTKNEPTFFPENKTLMRTIINKGISATFQGAF